MSTYAYVCVCAHVDSSKIQVRMYRTAHSRSVIHVHMYGMRAQRMHVLSRDVGLYTKRSAPNLESGQQTLSAWGHRVALPRLVRILSENAITHAL